MNLSVLLAALRRSLLPLALVLCAAPRAASVNWDGSGHEGAPPALRLKRLSPRPVKRDALGEAVARMSVEQLAGQMLMIAVDPDIAEKYKSLIQNGRLGGGLLRWDRLSAEGVRRFTDQLRSWAPSPQAPFLMAVDHEGGPHFTQRSLGATVFPGNMALAAAGSAELAERAARLSARELRALGLHVVFAPVLDVNSNPDNPVIGVRSFGDDPARVATLGAAAVRGYLQGGMLPVIKHFPGHGDTAEDSHLKLPSYGHSERDLRRVDLRPFEAAIRAGAPLAMPAHILLPWLGGKPATLEPKAVDGLLRKELGFGQRVVVSDSMDMGAIADNYTIPEAAVLAVEAGNDLLLLGKADPLPVLQALTAAVASKRLTRERLETSVRRILRLKRGLAGPTAAAPDPGEGGRLAWEIAERSVTLLRNEGGLLPLAPHADAQIVVVAAGPPRLADELARFAALIRRRHPKTAPLAAVPFQPDAKSVEDAVRASAPADLLIVGSYQSGSGEPKEQRELLRRLRALGKPLVLVSLMNPYDLRYYEDLPALLCTYGVTDASLEAAVRVLFGEIVPRGRLPVKVSDAFPRGSGL